MLPVWGAVSCQPFCYISGEEPWATGGGAAQPDSQLQTGNAVPQKTRAAEFTEAHAVWLEWSCKGVPPHSHQPASECLP